MIAPDSTPEAPPANSPVRDVVDALRLKRALEASDAAGDDAMQEQIAELGRYVDVMRGWGADAEDRVEVFETNAAAGEAKVLRVTFETPDDLWRSVRRNINKDGVFVRTGHFPPIDTLVRLDVVVERPDLKFNTEAKVIWVNPHARSGRPMGMGLKFQWPVPEHRTLFRAFMSGDLEPTRLTELNWTSTH